MTQAGLKRKKKQKKHAMHKGKVQASQKNASPSYQSQHYICGDATCKKLYTQYASYYSHIRKKHGGKVPPGTQIPRKNSARGGVGGSGGDQQKGQNGQHDDAKRHSASDKHDAPKTAYRLPTEFVQAGDLSHKLKVVALMGSHQFVEILYTVGVFALQGQKNGFTREADDECNALDEREVDAIKRDVLKEFGTGYRVNTLTPLQSDAIQQLSVYWKRDVRYALTYVIIHAALFASLIVQRLVQVMQSNKKFEAVAKVVESRGIDAFIHFLDTLNTHLSDLKPYNVQEELNALHASRAQDEGPDAQELAAQARAEGDTNASQVNHHADGGIDEEEEDDDGEDASDGEKQDDEGDDGDDEGDDDEEAVGQDGDDSDSERDNDDDNDSGSDDNDQDSEGEGGGESGKNLSHGGKDKTDDDENDSDDDDSDDGEGDGDGDGDGDENDEGDDQEEDHDSRYVKQESGAEQGVQRRSTLKQKQERARDPYPKRQRQHSNADERKHGRKNRKNSAGNSRDNQIGARSLPRAAKSGVKRY